MAGESGLGEFWDNWIEESKEEKKRIQELIEKRKQEAKEEVERLQEVQDGKADMQGRK